MAKFFITGGAGFIGSHICEEIFKSFKNSKIIIYDKGIDRTAKLGEDMDYDNPQLFDYSYRSGDVISPEIVWTEP